MTDLAMMRDVEARYALRDRPLRYTVLSPVGTWVGRGALRVLRVRERGDSDALDIVLGYDAYEAA